MISRILTAAGAALLAAAPGAESFAAQLLNVDWTVERSRPPEVRVSPFEPDKWGIKNGGVLGLSAGGYRLSGRDHDRRGLNDGGVEVYRFDEATVGAGVSEAMSDFSVGDYLSDLPVAETNIDWVAMVTNADARAVREQYVRFVDSDNPTNRILVTRSGVFSLDWVLKDGTLVPRTYEVGLKVSEVPRRIFWTSKPFDAPVVQLPSGMGFRPVGDPKLFGGSFTNDYGVYVDLDNRVVGANARVNADGTFDGPRGQFVLFYYDSPDCQHCLGFEVVEVGPPDPTYQSAHVGEEVHPSNWELLNADDVLAIPETSEDTVMGTVGRAPYLLQQQANPAIRHKKAGKVFAISETEPGDLGAQKAAVYWEAKGPSGVYWPFERTCYHITWPDDCPMMIIGDGDPADGCEIGLPDLYQATLLGWRVPEGVVQDITSSNTVRVLKPGHFTLRFDTKGMDDFFLLPITAVRHDDPRFERPVVTVDVGEEVTPAFGVRAGRNADLAAEISHGCPGYIYEPASPGRNWNPHLYHGSVASGMLDDLPAEEDADPYAALGSAIYLVSPTPTNEFVEVWWKDECFADGMEEGAVIPVLPQRYHAVWPKASRVPEICIASQMGSDAPSAFCDKSEPAIYFKGDPDSDPVAFPQPVDIATAGFTVAFGVNVAPDEADGHTVRLNATPCEFLSLAFLHGEESGSAQTNGDLRLSFRTCAPEGEEARFEILSTLTRGREIVRKTIVCAAATNDWTDFAVSVVAPTNNMAPVLYLGTNRLEAVVDNPSGCDFDYRNLLVTLGGNGYQRPAGVAVSGVCVYGFPLESDDLRARETTVDYDLSAFLLSDIAFGDFGDGEGLFVVDWERGDADYIWGCAAIDGEPVFRPSSLYAEGGVEPRVYWNNKSGTIGYCPNLQHAFTTQEGDHYVVWALRNDLCTGDERPYVLAEYPLLGRGAMQIYSVTFTNEFYRMPLVTVEAGNKVPTFRPLDRLQHGLSKETTAESVNTADDGVVTYRDRTGQLWARRDGAFKVFYSYPLEQGFFVPGEGDNQPPEGTSVNFMCCASSEAEEPRTTPPTLPDLQNTATPVNALANWPRADGVPLMKVAQVLTKAKDGLPEVWNARSIAAVYPSACTSKTETVNLDKSPVKVIDPTVKRTYPIPLKGDFVTEYEFTLGDTGSCVRRRGLYYFQNLPPSISDRFYVDVNSNASNLPDHVDMVLEGRLVENAAGTDYLLVNTLTKAERDAIANLSMNGVWKTAASNLAKGDVEPSILTVGNPTSPEVNYKPADHYALVATGKTLANGFDYVTLIENDSAELASDLPVTMHVIAVTNELYRAPLVVLEDANNALSEQLTVYYAAGLGESADNFEFQWIRREPPTDGSYPHDLPDADPPPGWENDVKGVGLVSMTVPKNANTKDVDVKDLVNTYWTVRYWPNGKNGFHSHWCEPTLAEGWLQRVLNRITPFSQRLTDFYTDKAELDFNMPAQIGAPYQGDVALNNDNLESVGLMQLYQTIFNRVESMSIAKTNNSVFTAALGKQLVETVARLADLNLTLAGEAYSDAKNPLIATTDPSLPANGSLFSFANQVPTLLDEELALLRGRSAAVAPLVTKYPYYNRLFWNLTKGITQGEVAYVNNYNIAAKDGVLDAAAAAASYPQGHGDAYGYYLSAVKLYYRLLRNPNFQWGEASMMEMLVSQNVVNMDYQEEDKFAEAAKDLAKTATDILDLTARKQWRDTCGNAMESGYFDDSGVTNGPFAQAFGYGEWAVRGALGAFYNWATANSILPDDPTNAVTHFTDQSIKTVDRGTCTSLKPLGAAVATLERKLNDLDAGVNPLGLSPDTVPFDINPTLLSSSGTSEGLSHYDQIRVRAVRALENCATVLAYANAHGSRIRAIEDADTDESNAAEETEASYNKQLVAIYGRPYSGDIGPGKTYEQGYVGPDLFHYNWMDLSQFGLQDIKTTHYVLSQEVSRVELKSKGIPSVLYSVPTSSKDIKLDTRMTVVTLDISGEGIVKKPDDITGRRAAEGTLQAAYRDFLAAYVDWKGCESALTRALDTLDWKLQNVNAAYEKAYQDYKWTKGVLIATAAQNSFAQAAEIVERFLGTGNELSVTGWAGGGNGVTENLKNLVVTIRQQELQQNHANNVQVTWENIADDGVAGQVKAALVNAATGYFKITSASKQTWEKVLSTFQNLTQIAITITSAVKADTEAHQALMSERKSAYETAIEAYNDFASAVGALKTATETLQAKYEAYRTILEEGEALQEELMTWRRRKASAAVSQRYADMYERIARNTALATYSTAFDVAQRYVFELAKVYDYETGLLSADRAAGDDFLAKAVATRALGDPKLTVDSSQFDGGLWDIVNRMDANWEVIRGRLGVNNPDNQTKRFSLRYSKFRIDPGEKGDVAWQKELSKPGYWREDVFADAAVSLHCQPQQGPSGQSARKEPGFVILFRTCVNAGENFFGQPLLGGETTFASADYSTKIQAVGVEFVGYDGLVRSYALADEPNVYLVPVGVDSMRFPAGTERRQVDFKVVDQVLPLPYTVGSAELDDPDWIATFSGLDGALDSAVTIRRHSTLRAGKETTSSRLVGRSVWNDSWILVIPASSLHSDAKTARQAFLNGVDTDNDGRIDVPGVSDIRLIIRAYSRQGN